MDKACEPGDKMYIYAKQFKQFCLFIEKIKEGKEPVMFAKDYVVISKKAYENLIEGSNILNE